MSSTEFETAAESPEELTNISQQLEDPPESFAFPNLRVHDSAEKPTHIRFLVSKTLAGSVIGKGGSTITEFQAISGARILLSRSRVYFPGTTDRVVVVSGTIKEVVTALELVLGKLHSEVRAEYGGDAELKRIRIVVPHRYCGAIIGRGGATIKSIIEDSKAGVKISPLDNAYFGLDDRLVTVSGTMEEQMRAITLIVTNLTEDDVYSWHVHSPNSHEGHYNRGFHGRNSVNYTRGLFQKGPQSQENFNWVTIGVPDEHIGAVIGLGGSQIKWINLDTGARIKISGRGDFIPGTTDRKVTISGFQGSIDSALTMIKNQVDYLESTKAN